jgi:hypothetical protein
MRLSVKSRRHPRVSVRLSIFPALSLCFRIGWPSQKVKASSSLLSPWLNADSAVSAAYSDGSFRITANGEDIYNAADAFHYVYKPLTGDGQIVAHVQSVRSTSDWARAGIMIRQNLDSDLSQSMVMVIPGKGIDLQRQATAGADNSSVSDPLDAQPLWGAMTRTGNMITATDRPLASIGLLARRPSA